MLEISGVDLRNYTLLDESEFDEELFSGSIIGITIKDQFLAKSRRMNLDFQTVCSSPDSPPPKHL